MEFVRNRPRETRSCGGALQAFELGSEPNIELNTSLFPRQRR